MREVIEYKCSYVFHLYMMVPYKGISDARKSTPLYLHPLTLSGPGYDASIVLIDVVRGTSGLILYSGATLQSSDVLE